MRLFRSSVRWRLAAISAGLTFLILCTFAIVIGQVTTSRIRSDFDNALAVKADQLADEIKITNESDKTLKFDVKTPFPLSVVAGSPDTAIRILAPAPIFGRTKVLESTPGAPKLPLNTERTYQVGKYRVQYREQQVFNDAGTDSRLVLIQYARKSSDLDSTVRRVRLFLIVGVLGGTICALVAGIVLAGRAMAPIARLTDAARSIAQTRDPNRAMPNVGSDDEIGELTATLDEMLQALSAARGESEEMLARQRRFVADASHELRTPLTSVLANLELLTGELEGEGLEAAESALRSSQRMRRLVADLLLLARADANRDSRREYTDMGTILVNVAAELGPITAGHDLEVSGQPAMVDGSKDDLHRMVLNLVENALHHTPPGSRVYASTTTVGGSVVITVEDDGPGIAPDVRDRLFERFVRAGDDSGGSFGLGLPIVKAVAEAHGGTVTVDSPRTGGARFTVRLPAAAPAGSQPGNPVRGSAEA